MGFEACKQIAVRESAVGASLTTVVVRGLLDRHAGGAVDTTGVVPWYPGSG